MDRYAQQRERQNAGLPCSDCGAHQGHFSFCPLFGAAEQWTADDEYQWQTTVLKKVAPYLNEPTMASVLGFPDFTEEDHVHAHGMGIKL